MRNILPSILLTLVILGGFPFLLVAQANKSKNANEKTELQYRQFRFAFIPGLSTNGTDADRYLSQYSLNLLAGYNGALKRGVELGGLLNINRFYAHGAQISGIANLSGDESSGFQLAGILNLAGSNLEGIQISGVANVARHEMMGIQLTGGVNWSDENSMGIQVSGVANRSGDNMQGVFIGGLGNTATYSMQGIMVGGGFNIARQQIQGVILSGGLNYSEMFQGIAAGSVNLARDFQGIQTGAVNVATYGQGIQIGLVNVGREFEGMPIGLVSYYIEGRRDIDVWADDGGFTNVGIKLGTHGIYNMISAGINPLLDREVWQLGWSIGRLHEYRNHYMYSDFSYFKINESGWTKDLNSVLKYRLLFGKDFGHGFQIYGGPTFNMMISRVDNRNSYTWYRLFDFTAKNREYVFWIGYSVGFELL